MELQVGETRVWLPQRGCDVRVEVPHVRLSQGVSHVGWVVVSSVRLCQGESCLLEAQGVSCVRVHQGKHRMWVPR